jgi:hypothetical protein
LPPLDSTITLVEENAASSIGSLSSSTWRHSTPGRTRGKRAHNKQGRRSCGARGASRAKVSGRAASGKARTDFPRAQSEARHDALRGGDVLALPRERSVRHATDMRALPVHAVVRA